MILLQNQNHKSSKKSLINIAKSRNWEYSFSSVFCNKIIKIVRGEYRIVEDIVGILVDLKG